MDNSSSAVSGTVNQSVKIFVPCRYCGELVEQGTFHSCPKKTETSSGSFERDIKYQIG